MHAPRNRILTFLLSSFATTIALALVSCISRPPAGLHPNEAPIYASDSELFPLHFHEDGQVPLSVQRDLDELNKQCMAVGAHRPRPVVHALSDGRALVLQFPINSIFVEENESIYLWPDWQNPEQHMALKVFREVNPISPTVIRLEHYEWQKSKLLDVRRPQHLFHVGPGFASLKIAPNNKWFGLHQGELFHGELTDPDSLNQGTRHVLDSKITNLTLVHHGELLLTQGNDGSVRIFSTDTMHELSRIIDASLGPASNDGTFIRSAGRYAWFTFQADGSFTAIPFKHGKHERPMHFSHCGQWVVTMGRMWVPGMATSRWRPLPAVQPTTPKPDSKENRKIIAWLRWAPTHNAESINKKCAATHAPLGTKGPELVYNQAAVISAYFPY